MFIIQKAVQVVYFLGMGILKMDAILRTTDFMKLSNF